MKEIKKFIEKYRLYALREVLLFMIITVVIHYSFRYWANELHFEPVREDVRIVQGWLIDDVYVKSKWVVSNVLNIPIITDDENKVIYFNNNGYIGVSGGCSGFKQILQFLLLFLIYPGPWKHKLWFIPFGILIVYLTNLMRIISLSVVVITYPEQFLYTHDYIVRPFFYVVIFGLWMLWVEKIYPLRMKPKAAVGSKE